MAAPGESRKFLRRRLQLRDDLGRGFADMRTIIDDDPSLRSSMLTRQALAVALVKPARGSWSYQAKNPFNAIS